jgi:hypothetical protein
MTERKPPRPIDAYAARRAGAQEIKAFTHPLRMRLYRLLSDQGRATASMLARETGESSGQTSYHLRQLEKFGFVEEVAGEGTARERWWQALGFSVTDVPDSGDQADQPWTPDPAAVTLHRFLIDEHAAVLHRWLEQARAEPRDWLRATTSSTTACWMTRTELEQLSAQLLEVVEEHTQAARARHERGETEGERRVRVYLDTLVLPDATG